MNNFPLTAEELLDIAQWLEDAAEQMEDTHAVIDLIKKAEFVRHKVSEME